MFLIQSLVVLSDFELSPNMNTAPESIHILKTKTYRDEQAGCECNFIYYITYP